MTTERWKMQGNYTPWYFGFANCDKKAVEVLRTYYENPSFLPEGSKSDRRDWIFMGTPGFGARLHLDHNLKHPSWQALVKNYLQTLSEKVSTIFTNQFDQFS